MLCERSIGAWGGINWCLGRDQLVLGEEYIGAWVGSNCAFGGIYWCLQTDLLVPGEESIGA